MTIFSSPISELESHYDAIVIGSGYGGAIAASRLARSRKRDGSALRVCLLERGREISTGRFPDEIDEAARQMQIKKGGMQIGQEDGLFELNFGDDISVLQGCGLGGTSLINANVSLPPDERVWREPEWPRGIRDDLNDGLKHGFGLAESMLRPRAYPDRGEHPPLAKYDAHVRSAEHMGESSNVYHPPINVTFESGINHVGIDQTACNGCGDCVSGCNVGAKNTLMTNYIPDAANHGCKIFCGAETRSVSQTDGGWRIHYQLVGCDREKFEETELFVTADLVVISAGSLNSAAILQRSKESGLACSNRIGHRFTGNGDVLGFGYNNDVKINGIGYGDRDVEEPVGPCISGIIDLRNSARLEDGFVLEEGSIPGAVSAILPGAFATAAQLTGDDTDGGLLDELQEGWRTLRSMAPGGAYAGAVRNTQTFLIMSHDDGNGRITLEEGRPVVHWPGVGQQEIITQVTSRMRDATAGIGGTFIPNPIFNKVFGYDLVTVHPLGGCVMADVAGDGVVNHKGQVFSGEEGDAVHENLYVSDGAVLPRPLGVNPLLTISAVAERNMALLADDRGWTLDTVLDSGPDRPAPIDGVAEDGDRLWLQFTERMAGHCSTDVLDDYETAEARGISEQSTASFLLTVMSDDLDRMVDDSDHEANIVGTVRIPALSRSPMTTSGGRFNLFIAESEGSEVKKMRYRLPLRSVEGESYFFDGYKVISNDAGADLWEDTTKLYVTVHRGDSDSGEVVAKGIQKIAPKDFAVQMTTMKCTDAEGGTSLTGQAKFGLFFAGALWDSYAP